MEKKTKCVYSGKASEAFWRRINKFRDKHKDVWGLLYGMGCHLQNMEGRLLSDLEELELKHRKPKNQLLNRNMSKKAELKIRIEERQECVDVLNINISLCEKKEVDGSMFINGMRRARALLEDVLKEQKNEYANLSMDE